MVFLFGLSGRIGRGGWWLGQLISTVLIVVGIMVAFQLKGVPADMEDFYDSEAFVFLSYTFLPVCIWINFATTVKRNHDRNKSGLYALVVFIPTVGSIYQIVTCGIFAGDLGQNSYGPVPGSGKKKKKKKFQTPKISTAAIAGSKIPDFSKPKVAQKTDWSFEKKPIETGRVRPEPAPVMNAVTSGFGQRSFGQRGA